MGQTEINFNGKPPVTEQLIKERIHTHREWARRGVIAIWNNQTKEEKSIEATIAENGIGFNAYDAHILSKIAKACIATGRLDNYEWAILKRRLPKYSGQLLKIARAKKGE